MDFKQTGIKLPVANFDPIVENEEKKKHHGDLLYHY